MSFKNSNFTSGNSDDPLYVDPADRPRVVVPVGDDSGNDVRNTTAEHAKLVGALQSKLDNIKAIIASNPELSKSVDMTALNIDPSTIKPSQISGMLQSVSALEQQVSSASTSEDVDVVSTTTAAVGAIGKMLFAKRIINNNETDPKLLALLAQDEGKGGQKYDLGAIGVEGGNHHSRADLGALQPTVIQGQLAVEIAKNQNSGRNITV